MDRQKHFFTLFFGTGLNVILGVITTPIVTRLVDPDVYGELSLFTLYGSILLVFMLIGQDQSYNRYYFSAESNGFKRYILRLTSGWPILLSFVAGGIACLYYIFAARGQYVVLIFAVYCISMVVDRFTNMTLRLGMRSGLYSFCMNMHKLSYTVFVILGIKFTDIDHILILTGCTVLAQVVSAAIGFVAERDKWNFSEVTDDDRKKYRKVVDRRMVLKYGWPFIFSSLCAWLYTGSDKLMIEMFSTRSELGIYASALSVIGIFSVITNTFNTIWAPMAVEEYEKDQTNKEFFIKATDYVTIILFAAGAGVILFKDIIVYLLGPEYREAVFLIPFLSLYPVLYTISESTVYGINFAKKTQWHILVTASCGIVNVVLNYFLIQRIGSLGAAVATGITYTLLLTLRTALSIKCFPVKYHLGRMGVMLTMYYVYIIYNSFHSTDLAGVAMFAVFAVTGIVLYRTSVKELLKMTGEYAGYLLKKPFGKK